MTVKTNLRILLLVLLALAGGAARAQYYTWGSDAPTKWSSLRAGDARVIFPDTAEAVARRMARTIEALRPVIGRGFTHGPMEVPFVVHAENFESNGLVMYLPRRVEFLSTPAVESYAMPWVKQLVAHEWRHAVQYNNLDRGIVRVLSRLIGQQGSVVGLLNMPLWAIEGDAVMMETSASSFGRALQPSFTMGYRAMGRFHDTRRNVDKWFCGSYRDYVPDHYELGYQICAYAYDRYGENIWDKVARFGARNLYMIFPTTVALGRYYDTDVETLFHRTFDDLERHWDSLPEVREQGRTLAGLEEGNHTTYRWPLAADGRTVVAHRTDYDRPGRFVAIDRRTGAEREIARTGLLSTRPVLCDGVLYWTEYRRSTLFEERVRSRLCALDLAGGRPRTLRPRNALYPVVTDRGPAWVEYTPDGRYAVCRGEERLPVPADKELHGLAWDDGTRALYALVTDDDGMWIARVDGTGLAPLTRPSYVTLSDLSASAGRLYFGSIASGRDEVHCYDLASGREYRITTSAYGSFDPSAAGGEVLCTAYDRRGYRVVAHPAADSLYHAVSPRRLPDNVVNPRRRLMETVCLDTVRLTGADSLAGAAERPRRYRKGLTLFNLHSWAPVAFDPFEVIDEHDVDLNWGATLLSQNLLSSMEAFLSYGWNRREGSLVDLGLRYNGLGPEIGVEFSYGGDRRVYALAQYDPAQGTYESQPVPAPERYRALSATLSLPLCFQRGYHTRVLTLGAGWNYSNGLVARMERIERDDEGRITNLDRIGFRRGLHKLSLSVGFSDQVQLAHRDFLPRWGYLLHAGYHFNPTNRDFSDLLSLYGRVYLPGAVQHHALRVAAAWQHSVGGYALAAGYRPLGYTSSLLIPRGFSSSEIRSDRYTAASADYQLPLCYPDGGIGSVLYFKRIRLGVGGDWARYRLPAGAGWRHIWSAGADLAFDVNFFRQPASATSTFTLSAYRPSKGGMWWSVSVGLPF